MRPALITNLRRGRAATASASELRLDRDEVGRAADLDAVVVQAEHARGGLGHHLDRRAPARRRGGSWRGSRSAWRVRACRRCRTATRHRGYCRSRRTPRRHARAAAAAAAWSPPPGPWLMMAMPASASRSAVRSARSVGTEPSAKAWLIATLPFRPAAARALGDRQHLGDAAFAAVVQMDVDADAAPLGDGEDRDRDGRRGRRRCRPDRGRPPGRRPAAIAASSSSAVPGERSDAALREGDDLDGDQVAEALAHLQDLRGGS